MADELSRRMGDLIRIGTVIAVDVAAARIRVKAGDVETDWTKWPAARAGATRTWSPPSEGEQVLLLCPDGDIERAIAGFGVFSNANSPPFDDDRDGMVFADGGRIFYDAHRSELVAEIPEAGQIHLQGGRCVISMRDGVITLKADEIVTDGLTRLNNGTRAVAFRGSTNTRGDTSNDGADGVYA